MTKLIIEISHTLSQPGRIEIFFRVMDEDLKGRIEIFFRVMDEDLKDETIKKKIEAFLELTGT